MSNSNVCQQAESGDNLIWSGEIGKITNEKVIIPSNEIPLNQINKVESDIEQLPMEKK